MTQKEKELYQECRQMIYDAYKDKVCSPWEQYHLVFDEVVNPAKEALEKKKAAMGLDSKLSEEEKRRMRIRRGFGYAPEEMEEKRQFGFKGIRNVVFIGSIVLLVYLIFGTPVIENFIEMFLSLGK